MKTFYINTYDPEGRFNLTGEAAEKFFQHLERVSPWYARRSARVRPTEWNPCEFSARITNMLFANYGDKK